MTIINKSEKVEIRGIEETIEYLRTALKQGYDKANIRKVIMGTYEIEITKSK